MPDAPNIVESGIAVHGQKDLQDIDMHLKFDRDDIEKYESLNVKAEFLNRCQSKEMCQNLFSWIALELHFLHICDVLPTHAQKTIDQTEDIIPASTLAAGASGDDGGGEEEEVDGDGGAPKSLTVCEVQ